MNPGGVHLIIDGRTSIPLTVPKVERFLRHFPRLVGVRRITEPEVVLVRGGLCGIVIIAQSHISVHTQGCNVWTDIFSCLGFDTDCAIRAAQRLLDVVECRSQTISRVMPPYVSDTPAGGAVGIAGTAVCLDENRYSINRKDAPADNE